MKIKSFVLGGAALLSVVGMSAPALSHTHHPSTATERKQIFSIQLTKRKRNPLDYDLDRIAAAAQGFSGAEIESAVQTALYAAYSSQRELATEDVLTALSTTVPLSTTRAEEIAQLRGWARQRAVWASTPEAKRERA